jgi:hypothetical protein
MITWISEEVGAGRWLEVNVQLAAVAQTLNLLEGRADGSWTRNRLIMILPINENDRHIVGA